MAEQERVRLDFEGITDDSPRLVCWTLTAGGKSVSARPRDPRRPYQWERSGPRVLALALVRLARWKGCGHLPDRVPLLSGVGRPSEATCLGDAALKMRTVTWWTNLLAVQHTPGQKDADQEAEERLRHWFVFENIQGRRTDKETLVLGMALHLPPDAVEVCLDGQELSGAKLDRLERKLSATLFGSLPPLLTHRDLTVAGYLPSTGSACVGRDDVLAQVDDLYDQNESRVLALLGGGGSGKTTLAREWLGRRCMSGSMRQGQVFSWSFYRQGYGAGSGQLLAEFHARLAEALGVTISDMMLPTELAHTLCSALHARPTLLFLDGLEVLQDASCQLPGGVRDAALAELLLALGCDDMCKGSFVLITTRTALRESTEWTYPEVQHLKLRALSLPGEVGLLHRQPTTLEWAMASRQVGDRGSAEVATLLAAAEKESGGDALPTLVRRALESLNHLPEWALLLATSLFDRPAEWAALRFLLASQPPLPRLTERWQSLPEETWEEALESLQSKGLLHVDSNCRVVLHPRIAECLAEEMRRSLMPAWMEGHRRLFAYFAEVPRSYTPDTVLEMEPLFRAAWHGCQAGDYRQVYDTILFPRVARGNSGYPIFELGAYETGLHLSELLAPDHATFAPGCELLPDDLMIMIHLAALCLRYMDRLEEAYEVEQRSWARLGPGCTAASIGPTGIHLLRCQHIFGDLHKSGPVTRQLARTLSLSPMSARGLKVPPSYLAIALGLIGSMVATILWAKGHGFAARTVMRLAASRAVKLDKRGRSLAPGMAGPWHALVLLDFGDWRTVEKAIVAGEMEDAIKRNRQTGMIELATGRMLSAKAKSHAGHARTEIAAEALNYLTKGLKIVQRNHFRWWTCAFLIALAEHHLSFGEKEQASQFAQTCFELAKTNHFALMEIDAGCLLADMSGQPVSAELRQLIEERDYGRAKKRLPRA